MIRFIITLISTIIIGLLIFDGCSMPSMSVERQTPIALQQFGHYMLFVLRGAFLAIVVIGVLAIWQVVIGNNRRKIYEPNENGDYPVIVENNGGIIDYFLGRAQRAILYLNNADTSAAQMTVDRRGNIDMSAAPATDLTRANVTGRHLRHQVRNVRTKAAASAVLGNDPYQNNRYGYQQLPDGFDVEQDVVDHTLPIPNALDGLRESDQTRITIGYNISDDSYFDVNEVVHWDVNLDRHARFHGATGSGKTTLAKVAIANMLSQGWHVIIVDRRSHKDYQKFRPYCEFVDVKNNTSALIDTLASIQDEYTQRDALCASYGVSDISQTPTDKPRICVVIDEYGAMMTEAEQSGLREATNAMLRTILQEAGSTGIHVLIVDQKPMSEGWDSIVRANATFIVSGYLPKSMNRGLNGVDLLNRRNHELLVINEDSKIKTWPLNDNDFHVYESMFPHAFHENVAGRKQYERVETIVDEMIDDETKFQKRAFEFMNSNPDATGADLWRHMKGHCVRSHSYRLFNAWRLTNQENNEKPFF